MDEWIIENILKKRKRIFKEDISFEYLVEEYYIKWKGFDECSWHTVEELNDYGVNDFEKKIKEFIIHHQKSKIKKAKKPSQNEQKTKWDQAQKLREETAQKYLEVYYNEKVAIEIMNREEENERRRQMMANEAIEQERKRREWESKRAELDIKKRLLLDEIYLPLSKPKKEEDVAAIISKPKEIKTFSYVPKLFNLCIANICDNLMLYEGFENVPVPWKALMFRYLSRNKELTHEKFSNILDPLQKTLDLSVCRVSITEEFFSSLEKCPMLTSLTVTNSPRVFFTFIALLGKNCKNLKRLNLSGCNNINSLAGLSKCSKLQELHLEHMYGISGFEESMSELYKLANLEVLKINNNSWYATNLLKILQSLKKLTHLYANDALYSYHQLKPDLFKSPIVATNLQVLNISHKNFILHFKATESINSLFFKKPNEILYPNLKELSLPGMDSSSVTSIISSLKKLKSLCINILYYSQNGWIKQIPKTLTSLELIVDPDNPNAIDPDDIERIVKESLPLKKLQIFNARMNGVESLIKLFKNEDFELEELDISNFTNHHSLGSILSPSDVNWEALCLNTFKNLKNLNISGLNWMGIKHFRCIVSPKVCPNIEYLNMAGISVYNDMTVIQYLLDNFPKLHSLVIGPKPGDEANPNILIGLSGGYKIKSLELWAYRDPWYFVTKDDWLNMLKSFPRLKTLTYTAKGGVFTVKGLMDALLIRTNIKEVNLIRIHVSSEKVKNIIKNPKSKLELLRLSDMQHNKLSDCNNYATQIYIVHSTEVYYTGSKGWVLKDLV